MEKKAQDTQTVLKTVEYGKLTVTNVPHTLYPRGIGPYGEKEYVDGNVLYKLTEIIKNMNDEGISEADYQDFS